jgi:hypothetical protein
MSTIAVMVLFMVLTVYLPHFSLLRAVVGFGLALKRRPTG